MRHVRDIGALVKKGDIICYVNDMPVGSPFDGIVRGLIMNHLLVSKGVKIGDVDPRGNKKYCFTLSDKALAIGDAVRSAILFYKAVKGIHFTGHAAGCARSFGRPDVSGNAPLR
jgi:xanthine dehydrogenase accessory factor